MMSLIRYVTSACPYANIGQMPAEPPSQHKCQKKKYVKRYLAISLNFSYSTLCMFLCLLFTALMLIADFNKLLAYSPPPRENMTFKIFPGWYYYTDRDKDGDALLNMYEPDIIKEGIL